MKILPYVLLSLLAGVIVPLQLAMVHAFRHSSGASQLQATFFLYLGGTFASLVLCFAISGGIKPPFYQNTNWWMWLTGFLGSFYILFMFIAAPKIGSASTLLWVFLGQMFFAVLINQMGWFGLETRPFNVTKILGLLLIFFGGLMLVYAEKTVK